MLQPVDKLNKSIVMPNLEAEIMETTLFTTNKLLMLILGIIIKIIIIIIIIIIRFISLKLTKTFINEKNGRET